MEDKKKILYDTLFDIFKIIFGYEIVFLGATILQTSSKAIYQYWSKFSDNGFDSNVPNGYNIFSSIA